MFTDFMFANEMLSDYGLMVCSFDSSNDNQTVSSGSNLTFNMSKPVGRNESTFFGSQYTEDYTAAFQCCRVDSNGRPMKIEAEEFSQLNRWLNRNDGFHEFKTNEQGYENIGYYGTFNIQAIKVAGTIYGLECSLITNSPYAHSDKTKISFSGKSFSLYDTSDETYEIYPNVSIICNETGTLSILNSLDDEIFKILNCVQGEIITICGNNKDIESSITSHNITNDFNYNYIKIVNTYKDRMNQFTSSLNINITFEYSPIRKAGI